MPRRVLFTIAAAVTSAVIGVSALTASAGLVDDLNDTVGDIGGNLPGGGGNGHIDLPGGGGIDLPGGGGGGGVTLPGGGGINLPGGSDGGAPIITPPGTTPTTPPTEPTDPTGPGTGPGGGDGGNGGGGSGDGSSGGNGSGGDSGEKPDRQTPREFARDGAPLRNSDGTPTASNPTLTVADFGPAPMGVPNFMIDQFSIPPFLLPIYQACGTQYGIPWQVLASINRIETAFGTNLNVSTAGAMGWMQFIPSTWEAYGTDANNDGRKDPYNPVDAICAAARYLNAAGGEEDLRTAIFAYNHADWYVDEVLLYAKQYGNLPEDLIGSLTGLTEGARFPVAADSRYADDISEREAKGNDKGGRSIDIFTREGAPVLAVNDGVIEKIGSNPRLGDYIVLRDAYGNSFTYAELGEVSKVHPVADHGDDKGGSAPEDEDAEAPKDAGKGKAGDEAEAPEPENTEDIRERIAAYPDREDEEATPELSANRLQAERTDAFAVYERLSDDGMLQFDKDKMSLEPLEEGSKVVAGTVLGRVGPEDELAPHLNFAIQPAGRGAPQINPKPILDGWKLLEATALYRASGKDPFEDADASSGQVLLMSKDQLIKRVLADPKVSIYPCGRQDVSTAQIDRRILALLGLPLASGFRLGVTSLRCGHSVLTSSGNVSNHSTGSAVDIATLNGLPVIGNQGPGSITETVGERDPRPPGRHGARRADLADGPRRPELRDERPRRPRPRRLLGGGCGRRLGRAGHRAHPGAEAGAVEAPGRSDRRDREPGGPDGALQVSTPAKKKRASSAHQGE